MQQLQTVDADTLLYEPLEKPNECKRRSREQKRMACIELSAKNDQLKKTMRSDTSINPIKLRHSAFQ